MRQSLPQTVQVVTLKEHFQFVACPPKVEPLLPAPEFNQGARSMEKIAAIDCAAEEFRTMTANQAAYAAILAMDGAPTRRIDRDRARLADSRNSSNLQSARGFNGEAQSENRGLHLVADTRGTGPRGPHPGDVLYWVACLGGACLLLLTATT
jgi:hypothetical protein